MKKIRLVVLPTLLLLLLTGCSTDRQLTAPATSLAYDYQAFDTTGTLVVKGTLIITRHDLGVIDGSWTFHTVGQTPDLGPQVGSGALRGDESPDGLVLDLNPDQVDQNVVLRGTFLDGRLSGDWRWITYAGTGNSGSFQALPR